MFLVQYAKNDRILDKDGTIDYQRPMRNCALAPRNVQMTLLPHDLDSHESTVPLCDDLEAATGHTCS